MKEMIERTESNIWHTLLERWSRELVAVERIARSLPPDVVASGWLGYPGATEEQIRQAETRLGTRLPPSYRTFLTVSNGWRLADRITERLWSTEEIEWFAVRHQEWIDAWMDEGEYPAIPDEEYLVYGQGQRPVDLRPEYLQSALEISTDQPDISSIYLLNPRIVTADGEWKAWYFANWLPGASRHRTFEELMQAEYEAFIYRRDDEET